MTGKTIFNIFDHQSENIKLKIWSNTGESFQNLFSIDRTTFAHVKYLAIQVLVQNSHLIEINNYKLISIKSKKILNEQKTLREEKVKNGDQYLLTRKLSNELSKVEQTSESFPIDEELIDERTEYLPSSSDLFAEAHLLTRRIDFRTDFKRILLTLIEMSQKLLWYHSDAEQIFKQAESILFSKLEILSKPAIESDNDTEIDSDQLAATELLLNEEKPLPLYSHNGPFIPFRQFRQQYFQPNPIAIQSLEEMGFSSNDIIEALRICHNNQNLACEYLLGDKQQLNIIDADNEEGLDRNSRLFKAIMKNPFIQQAINSPKIFFVLLQLYENPNLITMYINEPDIGNLILQINQIYNREKYEIDTADSN